MTIATKKKKKFESKIFSRVGDSYFDDIQNPTLQLDIRPGRFRIILTPNGDMKIYGGEDRKNINDWANILAEIETIGKYYWGK